MPTYEYECLECKTRFDVFQSINDAPVESCVKCNGRVRKIFSSTGIIFKGSGFYVNDYKKGGGTEKSGSTTTGSEKSSCPAADSCSSCGCSGGVSD
ncbi:MAG: FmdB family transcriptional regulator [Spirochaetes bacterium]|nr:FmdB family transcriptional regulator [Spirochaetota bacterium]